MKVISQNKAFGGNLFKYEHESQILGCSMKFNLFMPPLSSSSARIPLLYWLSGLTCTEDNFMQKAGSFQKLTELGIALIAPDTSPRGLEIPGENESYDFGTGAGFYLDAKKDPWSKNYKMYSYIVKELPSLLAENFSALDTTRSSIFGHSMGGHGAISIFLKNRSMFKSVSAFAPICNPMECQWGKKAFSGYLGEDNLDEWKEYDSVELLKRYQGDSFNFLIDQGSEDNFLKQHQLLPEKLVEVAKNKKEINLEFREQSGYDHSYYFISTFIADHIDFHARYLK